MTIANAVAERSGTPASLIDEYKHDFATLLPSHVDPGAWVRTAVGVVRSNPRLTQAASADVVAFLAALREAAQLGLHPGSDQYYLTIRGGKILGVVGYQGEIELMYRGGAVASVIAEVVREHDTFDYVIGRDVVPHHTIPWGQDRGKLILAYAYARMHGGATSKVVIADHERIARAQKASATAGKDHSPWASDPVAMWLKTAVHDLAKWVPTSAEYRHLVTQPSEPVEVRDWSGSAVSYVDTATGEVTEGQS